MQFRDDIDNVNRSQLRAAMETSFPLEKPNCQFRLLQVAAIVSLNFIFLHGCVCQTRRTLRSSLQCAPIRMQLMVWPLAKIARDTSSLKDIWCQQQ